jgi:hypothetical protein
MNARISVESLAQGKEVRAAELPVIRQGVFRAGRHSCEYVLLRPVPDQWVVMALVSFEPGAAHVLIVTDGTSETEAFRWLAQRLRQPSLPAALDAFATDWAMSATER